MKGYRYLQVYLALFINYSLGVSISETIPSAERQAVSGTIPATAHQCTNFGLLCYQDISMTATCDNQLKVWFDGVLQPAQPNVDNWRKSDTFDIPTGTKVIGLECKDNGVVPGILANFSDGSVTDDSWLCSSVYTDGWSENDFILDANWNNAVEFGTNAAPGYISWALAGNGIEGVSPNAHWIWTKGPLLGNPDLLKTVYCRKKVKDLGEHIVQPALPASLEDPYNRLKESISCCVESQSQNFKEEIALKSCEALDISMTATCDNQLKVWFDGFLQPAQPNVDNWRKSDTFDIPTGTKVIGLECKDNGVVPGILASFSDGSVTDDSWLCSSVYTDGWSENDFILDTDWNNAVEFGTNADPGFSAWSRGGRGVSPNAHWIWTQGPLIDNPDLFKTVYCRKSVKNLDSHAAVEDLHKRQKESTNCCIENQLQNFIGDIALKSCDTPLVPTPTPTPASAPQPV